MQYDELMNLKADLELEGYTRFVHPLDAEVALENPCEECGSMEKSVQGWRKDRDLHSYRVFSICNFCGNVVEF